MLSLVITVFLATLISACCSTTEAMLYSLPWTYIEKLRASGSKTGELLFYMRTNIDRPIMAVLTLNTVANTAGSAVAGAFAAAALGAENVPLFAVFFTILILVFGEIVPKTLGVAYAQSLAIILVQPLRLLMILFQPILWTGSFITRLISPEQSAPEATEDDIRVLASLSRKAGGIQPYEETAISNILALDQKRVHDVMTPRTMVFSLPVDASMDEAYHNPDFWHFSRIPVYDEDNEDIVGIVQRRQVALMRGTEGGTAKTLGDIMKPIRFVLESLTLDKVLKLFLESRQHLFAVLDEYGGLAGVISLEDVLEEMLGQEIMDESDVDADLRAVAKIRRQQTINAKES